MNDQSRRKEEQELVRSTVQETSELAKDRKAFLKFLGKHIDQAETAAINFGIAANQDDPNWYDIYLVSDLNPCLSILIMTMPS